MDPLRVSTIGTGLLLAMAGGSAWAQPSGGPNGAVARCKDGSLIFVLTSSSCRGHGGVTERFTHAAPTEQGVSERRVGPNGAIARCQDGRLVFVDTGAATCAGAGGVAERFRPATPADQQVRAQPAATSESARGGTGSLASSSSAMASAGQSPPMPAPRPAGPSGAVARCGNGSLVFVSSGPKTCQGYGGVVEWFDPAAPVLGDGGAPDSGGMKWWEALLVGLAGAAKAYGDAATGSNSTGLPAANGKVMIFGGPGSRTYLGCLSCSDWAPDSVTNRLGPHGSQLAAESILNGLGPYGSALSNFSVCNSLASDPPKVVDAAGSYFGRLTVNALHPERTTYGVLRAFAQGICSRR